MNLVKIAGARGKPGGRPLLTPLKARVAAGVLMGLLVAGQTLAFAWSPNGETARAQSLVPTPTPPARLRPAAYIEPAPATAPLPAISLNADQIALLLKTLDAAPSHGFGPDEFATAPMVALLKSKNAQSRRQGQDLLISETLRYAQSVHAGRLAPADFLYEWGLRPPPYDPAPDFAQAVAEDRLEAWLAGLPPPYTGYDNLRHSLEVYRGLAGSGGWNPVASDADLKPGMRDPRVAALRTRLSVEDSTVPEAPAAFYDDGLTQAVTRAQKRYGLEPDGVAHKSLIAALNVPVEERIQQIIANMERWRWLPPQLPADRIQVNIAAAVLTVFQNDTPVLSMRAVTGRPGDETPMLQSEIRSIVLNPPWNVPSTIAAKEIWPKERAHPGYLARNDFRVITNPDGSERLQQRAGDKAALGHVKFDFDNKYGVYLHDTPSHGTFAKYSRMVSHGCVRLEKPVVLANALMVGDPQWTPEAIQAAIADGDTVRAALPKGIAVFLLYWTAYAGPDGQTNFRGDPYGWDQALMERIAAGPHSAA
jgi:murein L,D-transpeptidase YcbB/YkuD